VISENKEKRHETWIRPQFQATRPPPPVTCHPPLFFSRFINISEPIDEETSYFCGGFKKFIQATLCKTEKLPR
jgi:hypothetical protein